MEAILVFAKKIWCVKRQLILILTPVALLPLMFALPAREGKCLYVVLLMAVFWCTETLPLAVTAMLPVCLFPLLGILPSSKVCQQYFVDTNFLFLSGLVMASAIEEWNLHRRIALRVLMLVGVKPAWLIMGMMITSAFLSMWLSNTATTAMMLPIGNAILQSLFGDLETLKEKCHLKDDAENRVRTTQPLDDLSQTIFYLPIGASQMKLQVLASEKQILTGEERSIRYDTDHLPTLTLNCKANPFKKADLSEACDTRSASEIRKESEYQKKVWKGFLISIPYAASIGGTATLTGTSPNLILVGQLKSFFPDCDVINFGSWFVFSCPLMLLFLFLGWLWISFLYGGLNTRLCLQKKDFRAQAETKARAVIEEDYKKLGPVKFAEGAIGFFFFLFAILLFTRDPKFFPGWAQLFSKGYVSDAVTGVSIVSILFFFPSQKPSLNWWFDFRAQNTQNMPLVSWKKAQETVPWNIILLLGGGFAMAKGCEESGLSMWIGSRLQPLESVPPGVAVLLITVVVASFTEFASNTATTIIFLPVLAELAMRLQVNPLYLMIPGTIGCSYAFMLPVSTPPNSIAFASGHLQVKDMVKTGVVMNILGVLSLSLAMNTWGLYVFDLHTYPSWARSTNVTTVLPGLLNSTAAPLNATL
ncbi:S13A3 protein, partial [Atractosteus spatula]|nr:S13A3 protein [Atractosteus spatula]